MKRRVSELKLPRFWTTDGPNRTGGLRSRAPRFVAGPVLCVLALSFSLHSLGLAVLEPAPVVRMRSAKSVSSAGEAFLTFEAVSNPAKGRKRRPATGRKERKGSLPSLPPTVQRKKGSRSSTLARPLAKTLAPIKQSDEGQGAAQRQVAGFPPGMSRMTRRRMRLDIFPGRIRQRWGYRELLRLTDLPTIAQAFFSSEVDFRPSVHARRITVFPGSERDYHDTYIVLDPSKAGQKLLETGVLHNRTPVLGQWSERHELELASWSHGNGADRWLLRFPKRNVYAISGARIVERGVCRKDGRKALRALANVPMDEPGLLARFTVMHPEVVWFVPSSGLQELSVALYEQLPGPAVVMTLHYGSAKRLQAAKKQLRKRDSLPFLGRFHLQAHGKKLTLSAKVGVRAAVAALDQLRQALPQPQTVVSRWRRYRDPKDACTSSESLPMDAEFIEASISKRGPLHFEVKRALVDSVLDRKHMLMRFARVVPHERGGEVVGVKVYGIRRKSLFGMLGLQNGDLVKDFNGNHMRSPKGALQAYTGLRTAATWVVHLERRGKPLTLNYTVSE